VNITLHYSHKAAQEKEGLKQNGSRKHSKVSVCKHLSDTFPIQNCIKQGYALLPLNVNFSSEYVIRKVQENQLGLKLSGTCRALVCADDVILLGDNPVAEGIRYFHNIGTFLPDYTVSRPRRQ
jgi:hypothetical protein